MLLESVLTDCDVHLMELYRDEFSTWINWNKDDLLPFGHKSARQRSRIVDFLATTGLLNGTNSNQVRAHEDGDEVRRAIQSLDRLDDLMVSPIILTHVVATDTSLEWNDDHLNRMTPLIETFLREIGDSLVIPDEVAAARGLPSCRTAVPAFHGVGGFACILSPAMCRDVQGLTKLREQKPTVSIIFNETNFEIHGQLPPGESAVLIVKPSIPGLYYVKQVRGLQGVLSPFGCKQMLTPSMLAFGIAMLLHLATVDRPIVSRAEQRQAVIAGFCHGEVDTGFGMMAAQVYRRK